MFEPPICSFYCIGRPTLVIDIFGCHAKIDDFAKRDTEELNCAALHAQRLSFARALPDNMAVVGLVYAWLATVRHRGLHNHDMSCDGV